MITMLRENLHKSFFRNPAEGAESNVPATYPGLSLGRLEHLYLSYGLNAIGNPIKSVGPPPIPDTAPTTRYFIGGSLESDSFTGIR